MESLLATLETWLTSIGVSEDWGHWTAQAIALVALLVVCYIALRITTFIEIRLVRRASRKTTTDWDDELVDAGVFARLAFLVPTIVFDRGARSIFQFDEGAMQVIGALVSVTLTVVVVGVVNSVLRAFGNIYEKHPMSERMPIRTILQVLQVAVFFVGGITVISFLLGRSPLVFFSGLGAFTAILMLVFRDAILGFVAGIQLSANNMVHRGDWIEMPSQGADGDVIEVNLTTVKVQNWDKTITTIPTYALVSESFKNWRGMSESGGRRIKRSVSLDMTSIRFADQELLDRFHKIRLLKDYLARKLEEVRAYNEESKVADDDLLINGRHLTNVGTFRAYLEAYLRRNAKIHKEMTFLVRMLAPSEKGLPIEIYVFSADQVWANYEAIQADIFDHVLAVLPTFDLRVFQAPTGADWRAATGGGG